MTNIKVTTGTTTKSRRINDSSDTSALDEHSHAFIDVKCFCIAQAPVILSYEKPHWLFLFMSAQIRPIKMPERIGTNAPLSATSGIT